MGLKLIKIIFSKNISLLFKERIIWLPFSLFALTELFFLIFVFLFPHPPFLNIFGPIIRYKWGEQFLHFPFNFILLPIIFNYLRIFLSATLGVIAAAWTVALVANKNDGISFAHLSPKVSWQRVLKGYFSLLVVWGMGYILISSTTKFLGGFFYKNILLRTSLGLFILSFWQTLFIFAVPELILERKKIFKAILSGFKDLRGISLVTFLIILVPVYLYFPLKLFSPPPQELIRFNLPELVVLLLIVNIFLTMFINLWVNSSTALLFLKRKEMR